MGEPTYTAQLLSGTSPRTDHGTAQHGLGRSKAAICLRDCRFVRNATQWRMQLGFHFGVQSRRKLRAERHAAAVLEHSGAAGPWQPSSFEIESRAVYACAPVRECWKGARLSQARHGSRAYQVYKRAARRRDTARHDFPNSFRRKVRAALCVNVYALGAWGTQSVRRMPPVVLLGRLCNNPAHGPLCASFRGAHAFGKVLVWQCFGALNRPTKGLKILVSVVQFRPWPPISRDAKRHAVRTGRPS